MVNTCNLYQAETFVVWSRFASFIEAGGRTGLGYRDTSQDVMSVPHTNPAKCRQRIIELMNGQMSQGYGLHLFEPEAFKERQASSEKLLTGAPVPDLKAMIHGLEKTCSDDALWIVASVNESVKETGETELFDLVVPFADYGEATIYEHLKRSLDFSSKQIGSSGICKGLRADWNDCLNLGGGKSAMTSFLHHWALINIIEAAEFLGRGEDVKKYTAMAAKVRKACEDQIWDGDWYLRGFTRKGIKIGSHENEEGKTFLESNSLAVLSEAASPEHGIKCMDSVENYPASEYGIHLNWPAFSKPDDDIGYVTTVYKGVKENADIFSHSNPWAVVADCKLGRGNRAMKFYNPLLPYNQNDLIEIREAEPYSYCQFVMGRDHTAFVCARHPWLTGSSGWMYHAVTHWVLGVRPGYEGLTVDPCIPLDWKEFIVNRQWHGATYNITVKNPLDIQKGVRAISLNGKPVTNPMPRHDAGTVNDVVVEMG